MLAVQECYISVCKEKDTLEESIRNGEKEEASIRENEVHVVPDDVYSRDVMIQCFLASSQNSLLTITIQADYFLQNKIKEKL